MNIAQLLLEPFADYDFMRFALCSIVFLAVGAAPVGVFLMMRRMSLVGDALGHAILPGAAIGYMLAGLSLPAMSIGGFMAGLLMALLAGLASRFANVREDASFAAFFLTCLALGVVLVSRGGNSVDLLNLLFGSILSVDRAALTLVAIVSSITMVVLAVIYRPLMLESIDPLFLRSVNGKGTLWHIIFLILVVLNLVSGFQALGTLMSVGLMMLPAISARLWHRTMGGMMTIAAIIAVVCGYIGLLLSYYIDLPSGPAIILCCGFVYILSLFVGSESGILWRLYRRQRHHVA
ncbi:zinc ABC transporter permease [Snodgrassella communis]|uniref:Zinc ABC transporter, inner membrane permease protein ZnuB n=1 Tax=Snodgrassella communis TaxID=2946699 RepID=A0A066TJR7_9NEIS|nr:metal ABC transporter permease [Snodgrassella communis]KDN12795.1 Zinc ABC transporter, inner membrane permease protein ZnuB [Snodgrassella communis]KDN15105.1 Zinc ABC transporter, inner membrane permease protein ZnuB [Snodgrassella communis]PIT10421.1 zinc ABC transporter permease [Snodgrassella communis]PIT26737.1 zinc ABC transporter permease [Snodgrassella communis]PIT29845.1 zinc ABC transporter permease [Snodgrassella communis]